MRGRALLVTAVVAGLLAPTAGAAVERDVSVKFQRFTPHQVIAVTGDTVKWTNQEVTNVSSLANHNLVENNGLFNSPLAKGATFSYLFAAPGTYQYHCSLHPGMHGVVVVSNLYLAGPGVIVTHGKLATFSGYAAEGSTVNLFLEGGATPVKTVTANATTGKFTASIPAVPGRYQAKVDPSTTSAFVRLNVKPKLNVKSAKKNGKYTITVSTSPSQAGGKVVLERKQGSKWKAISTHTLPAASKTAFTVKPSATMKVRLRLSVPKNGYSKTTSGTLTLRK